MSVSEAPIPVLTPEQGKALLRLARQTIGRKLGQYIDPTEATQLDVQLDDPALQTRRGTFVTLSIAGQLRGCIGSLSGDEPLAKGIRRNALNAAFHDFRFSPLTVADFDRIDIEVSILSEPRPLTYADADDLVSRLRPGVDGVILQDRGRSATFLPQVWEQLPRTEDFLSHLCSKAGLPADHWRHAHLDVQTYQVTYFEEHP